MAYQISRNGQLYGPYSLDDLERYLTSGHVLLTDLCKSEEMPDWLPVSQVLTDAGRTPAAASAPGSLGSAIYPPTSYAATGQTAQPGYAPVATLRSPPDLHWGLVLLFDVLTCSLFQMVWNIILGAWFNRIVPSSRTLYLYIAAAVLIICQAVGGQTMGLLTGRNAAAHGYSYSNGYSHHPGFFGLYALIATICWIIRLVARFNFRSELELHYNTVEPIGLQINPVLTFFFGGIYLQSVMNRINLSRRMMAYGAMPR